MSAAEIYRASASDWPKLPLIYEADGYDGAAEGMRRRAAQELAEFAAGDRLLWLADVDGRVAGTVGLVFRGIDAGTADGVSSANISRMHVVQANRRGGIGMALLGAAEAEARLRGFARLVLEVEYDNVPARALYEKVGYELAGPGYTLNDVAMAKALLDRP